ncbi:voltage-gated hydrogen channel 1-like [Mizuhopecten yessoensis]|uniref:Voltage-gated hydrogen channel 1 n=1 Tax=Mizuhopecten yessoensis TaxID=6573 RepID=A0A210QBR9_MIZYE|nr:voltage-gated hydrogen channel 1-like [Mizuhopecten yessoensis]OWF46169.1 Voltage-gated hydrogen channel 1 [Mizuhopecten yessoensis]
MENPDVSGDNANGVKQKLGNVMHSKQVHVISMCLLVLDAIFVLLLLFVDLDVIPVSGDGENHSKKEEVENGLHYTGLTILSLFMLEIMLKIIADGSSFFKKKLEVFDAAVVLVSFVLDIALSLSRVSSLVRDIVILMILLRLWRFFKLLVNVNIFVRKDIQNQIEAERELRTQAEKERDVALEKLKQAEEQCQRPVVIVGDDKNEPT